MPLAGDFDPSFLDQLVPVAQKHTSISILMIGSRPHGSENPPFLALAPRLCQLANLRVLHVCDRVYPTALAGIPKPAYSLADLAYMPTTRGLKTSDSELRGALDWMLGSSELTLRSICIPAGLPGTLTWLCERFHRLEDITVFIVSSLPLSSYEAELFQLAQNPSMQSVRIDGTWREEAEVAAFQERVAKLNEKIGREVICVLSPPAGWQEELS